MKRKFTIVSVLSITGLVIFAFAAFQDVFFGIYSELLAAIIITIFTIVLLLHKKLPTDEHSGKLLKIANKLSHPLVLLALFALLICQFTFLRFPHFGESYIRSLQLLLFLIVLTKEEEIVKRKKREN